MLNETTFTPSFEAPEVGDTVLVFRLTVTDTGGLSESDDISITVIDTTTASSPCDSDPDGDFECATVVSLPYFSESNTVEAAGGDFDDFLRFNNVESGVLVLDVQDTNSQNDIICGVFASTDREANLASSCIGTVNVSAGDYFLRVSASSSRSAFYTISISQ